MSRMRIAMLGAHALCLWGCSGWPDQARPDQQSSDPALAASPLREIQPLCDGSDGARLVYAAEPGWGFVYDSFTAAHGAEFLVVDGQCDYSLKGRSLRGLQRGHLEAAQASRLAAELQFGRYASASSYRPDRCADSALVVLQDDSARLVFGGCPPGRSPQVWSDAFAGIARRFPDLETESQPAWGLTQLLAVRDPAPLGSRRASAWTAELDLDEHAIDPFSVSIGVDPSAGVLVEDEPTLALLSELRWSALADDPDASTLYVEDENARRYELFLRDEPPSAIAAAVQAALMP